MNKRIRLQVLFGLNGSCIEKYLCMPIHVVENTVAGIQKAFMNPFMLQSNEPRTQSPAVNVMIVKGMQNRPRPKSAIARLPSRVYVLDLASLCLNTTMHIMPLPMMQPRNITISNVASII